MTVRLPPGVSESAFSHALERFRATVGAEHVLIAEEDVREFEDPFTFQGWNEHLPSAVLQPASVEEVQAIVRIANELRVPVWTSSQGRNVGYGGSAPRLSGSAVVNLRRMDRVLEVNEELAYCVVEPGVSFIDLYNHLEEGGHRLWSSCPGVAWGSVIGNTLEQGLGITAYWDHAGHACGMEVVLPNGELMRTGMGAIANSRAWHTYRRGYGPMADSLFMQSNFGIVTKMGRWLQPEPAWYLPFKVTFQRRSDLAAIVETTRPLLLNGTIPTLAYLDSVIIMAMYAGASRSDWYDGEGPIPVEIQDRMASELGTGQWCLHGAVYGDEPVVDHGFEVVKRAYSQIEGAVVEGRKLPGDERETLEDPNDRFYAGIPGMEMLSFLRWRASLGGEGAHHFCSPIAPTTGDDAVRVVGLMRGAMEEAGFDFTSGGLILGRSTAWVGMILFNPEDEDQTRRAFEASRRIIEEGGRAGYGEYRAHLAEMDLIADQFDFADHAQRRFNQALKDALDPNGILAPGKQGIWPSSLRPGGR